MKTTFLTKGEIWGDTALGIFKEIGTKVSNTDLAVLLGAWVSGSYKTADNLRCGYSWSASADDDRNVCVVDYDGDRSHADPD